MFALTSRTVAQNFWDFQWPGVWVFYIVLASRRPLGTQLLGGNLVERLYLVCVVTRKRAVRLRVRSISQSDVRERITNVTQNSCADTYVGVVYGKDIVCIIFGCVWEVLGWYTREI